MLSIYISIRVTEYRLEYQELSENIYLIYTNKAVVQVPMLLQGNNFLEIWPDYYGALY